MGRDNRLLQSIGRVQEVSEGGAYAVQPRIGHSAVQLIPGLQCRLKAHPIAPTGIPGIGPLNPAMGKQLPPPIHLCRSPAIIGEWASAEVALEGERGIPGRGQLQRRESQGIAVVRREDALVNDRAIRSDEGSEALCDWLFVVPRQVTPSALRGWYANRTGLRGATSAVDGLQIGAPPPMYGDRGRTSDLHADVAVGDSPGVSSNPPSS
jgi:hypothetical protein